ncbi:MAG: electron transfer flavoprotein subunit beta/FixA family protein [Flavobacteriaceae bacterium]|tara:strand:+ start:50544 stop:51290 length:747 start_codon:yes stop_codon:yes gene_type:complete
MKVLVCISCVPDTTSKISFIENETEFDNSGVQYIINPNDEFGLTRAIWMKQKQSCEVHAICVGGINTDPILRKVLAIGADQAFRVDSNPMDANQVAREISGFVNGKEYNLIIAGRESIDYNGGMVPGMIATLINANYVSNCVSLEVSQLNFKATRETDGGKEEISGTLPLVIGGQKGLVEESDLIIPNMRGIMMSRKKPLTVIEPKFQKSQTKTVKYEKLPPKGEVKLINPENINDLIDLLHNEAKVI